MEKRITARGIIIKDESVYLIYRRKNIDGIIKEYYVLPGGGVEGSESLKDALIREMKEELSLNINILGYLGLIEYENTIGHYFSCEINDKEIPKLGGPELDRNNDTNYYEIRKVPLDKVEKIDVTQKEMIVKAYNKDYIEII